jgi:hypothetical protein
VNDDDFPDPLAAFDQGLRALVDMAKALRAYYVALVAEGFTEEQAFGLTAAWQMHLLAGQE